MARSILFVIRSGGISRVHPYRTYEDYIPENDAQLGCVTEFKPFMKISLFDQGHGPGEQYAITLYPARLFFYINRMIRFKAGFFRFPA